MAIKKIIFSRTDKIGDFMLIWPALAYARSAFPEIKIDILVSPVVEEIAWACPYVDDVIVDSGQTVRGLRNRLRGEGYDAAIAFLNTVRVSLAFWAAGIPYRLAPATKVQQIFFNRRLVQRRSKSIKPEYEYNLDLIDQFLLDHRASKPAQLPTPPFWRLNASGVEKTATYIRERYGLPADSDWVIIHPGSGGSARNLCIDQYADLANRLYSHKNLLVIVTAGPGEGVIARQLVGKIKKHRAMVYESCDGLVAFANLVANAVLFISGSTGPLHIAGALDIPTLGFYPRRRSSTSLRWQTINQADKRLTYSPMPEKDELDMESIDIESPAAKASEIFLNCNGATH